jgi:long-chain acyl-CoA synthetase
VASAVRLPLEVFFERESRHPNKTYLTQPMDGGRVEQLTWAEVGEQARRAASWLRSLELPQGSKISIISKNSAHWIVTDLAIWMAGHVSVPLYPNLTAESVRQVLEHAEVRVAFIGKLDDWPGMAPGVPQGVTTVALPLHAEGSFDKQWSDLQACAPIQDQPRCEPDQLATIIYTSGTTGMPKGVMHNFGNFGFTATNATALFGVCESDRVLSYLPLCHVAERMFVELASLYGGMGVFFAESLDTFLVDLRRARPTVFFGVPRIWTKFQMGVYSKMSANKLDMLLSIPLLGRLFGRKVLRGLGLELQEVYGMTENCGYSHVCRPGKFKKGWIGQNNPGVEVRISEEGEVLVRSGSTMQGYYKEPGKTAEVLTEDGFLRTGDKGEQDAEGNLRLTGRIKEIFKTSKGKYVAPAPIENRLAVHSHIEQVCVVGDGLPQPLALCVLSDMARKESREQLETSLKRLLAETNQVLDKHEQLNGLVLVSEVWAVDNGFLTPTLKIKRASVETAYGPHFGAWVERREGVFWHPQVG